MYSLTLINLMPPFLKKIAALWGVPFLLHMSMIRAGGAVVGGGGGSEGYGGGVVGLWGEGALKTKGEQCFEPRRRGLQNKADGKKPKQNISCITKICFRQVFSFL